MLKKNYVVFISDVNECKRSPCQNNGTCVNNDGSYTCLCEPGWTGQHCQTGKYQIIFKKIIYTKQKNDAHCQFNINHLMSINFVFCKKDMKWLILNYRYPLLAFDKRLKQLFETIILIKWRLQKMLSLPFQMFKSVLQSTHASIMALASIIMVPIRVNVQMDGRGKIVRQVGTFKSNILNYSSDVEFYRLTQNIYLFLFQILTNVFHPRVIIMAAV